MSASQPHRRSLRLTHLRRPDVELSAETRRRLSFLKTLHDDDDVSLQTFAIAASQFAYYLMGQPESERFEATMQMGDHGTRALTGRPGLRGIALGVIVNRRDDRST